MIIHHTKKELMYLWLSDKLIDLKISLKESYKEVYNDDMLENPSIETQKYIKKIKKSGKLKPDIVIDKVKKNMNSNNQKTDDSYVSGYDVGMELINGIIKSWLENEEENIKEMQSNYANQGITLIVVE